MTLTEHQKYLIDKVIQGENPIENLKHLIYSVNFTKESLEYLRENVREFGYELKNSNKNYNVSYCHDDDPEPSYDPFCNPMCSPSHDGDDFDDYFVPLNKEKNSANASRGR